MREYRIGRLKGRFVVTWIEPDGRKMAWHKIAMVPAGRSFLGSVDGSRMVVLWPPSVGGKHIR